ncbi:hybrid sensor histidine kinase/response regulator [Leptothrix discophora]|uniref:histidine kinase n=1 Tax=Leptothrix discophora TaxID=89 RepID=A0ABT9G855_LEPDI|nr:ATP-binding protein [Leptothrix discophora]MDP4302660.1 ATP-binding protein [Leptothrix discophora]
MLRKYIASFVAVVGIPLVGYTVVGVWFAAEEHRAALIEVQRANAQAAAWRITQFANEIEGQLRWATHLSWNESGADQHRIDALRLLRQVPAITDLTLLDGQGRERLFVSRVSMDRLDTRIDRSSEDAVQAALKNGIHFGPVYFRRDTEPFISVALAATRREAGVVLAEVNLKFTRDVVSQVRVGREGLAYVVDKAGRLIAHPDASLVLRNTDLSSTMRVIDAQPDQSLHRLISMQGEQVLLAQAPAPPMDWRVLVELPQSEADEPWRRALSRSLWITAVSLLVALGFAVVFSWRMVRPIRTLTAGAARIGSGQLDHRIPIDSADEIGQLGHEFNAMAGELERSYATLERKVEQRTQALTDANRAKSRFVAAASHDLRQPLHALNLLVAQLRVETSAAERQRLTLRVESAVASINGLFDGLLDISKLDAGVVHANVTAFPLQQVLDRVEATFAEDAHARGLHLHVRGHGAWVQSDPVLLERILDNLVANALRYTRKGGVLVGCRQRGDHLRVEVWDTGIGIPPEKHQEIFAEFYQVAPAGTLRGEGLGLGLSIVSRLGQLLGHRVALRSSPGRGSCFSITLQQVPPQLRALGLVEADDVPDDPLCGARVLVIDNDEDILESTGGLLRGWGCKALTASCADQALERLGQTAPDLVLADVHLDGGEDGVENVIRLRRHFGRDLPAIVISGDVSQETRTRVAGLGFPLLEKPVAPLRLRTLATRLLRAATRLEGASGPDGSQRARPRCGCPRPVP